ncbi:MAG: hypothetical protein LBP20_03225 [Treponema sp.]|nr:hypothetical protein [Treponema sp.]
MNEEMKSMAFVSIPLLQAAELEPAGAYIPISFLPLVVLIGVIIAGVKYSRAFKKTGQKGAWKYLLGLYGIFLGFSILGRLMKNPAASSGVSSVEKKKSCGLFSFCTGEVSTPPLPA